MSWMISDDKDFDRRSLLHSKIFLFACATQIYEKLVGTLKASVILSDFSWSEAYPCKHIFISLHIPYIFLLSNSIFTGIRFVPDSKVIWKNIFWVTQIFDVNEKIITFDFLWGCKRKNVLEFNKNGTSSLLLLSFNNKEGSSMGPCTPR